MEIPGLGRLLMPSGAVMVIVGIGVAPANVLNPASRLFR